MQQPLLPHPHSHPQRFWSASRLQRSSPLAGLVVLEELAVWRRASVAGDHERVDDSRGRVDLIKRRLEAGARRRRRALERVLVVDPARVDRVHKDAPLGKVLGACARHHVERRLGHVGVRVVGRLVAVKLALHGGDVHHAASLD
eukprot:3871979-Pleurochrysis_carterae.AAC.1